MPRDGVAQHLLRRHPVEHRRGEPTDPRGTRGVALREALGRRAARLACEGPQRAEHVCLVPGPRRRAQQSQLDLAVGGGTGEQQLLLRWDARRAAGALQRHAQPLVLRPLETFSLQQHVLGRHGVLVQPVGGLESVALLGRKVRHQAREEGGGDLGRQEIAAVAVAELDEEEEVGREPAAALQFVEADAQRLAVGARRLAHPPAQVDGLQAEAGRGAQAAQFGEDAALQDVALDLEVGEGRAEEEADGGAWHGRLGDVGHGVHFLPGVRRCLTRSRRRSSGPPSASRQRA